MMNNPLKSLAVIAVCLLGISGVGRPVLADDGRKCFGEVCLIQQTDRGKVTFKLHNSQPAPITVTFQAKLKNMKASKTLPYTRTFRGRALERFIELDRVSKKDRWRYTYNFNWRFGVLGAVHDDSYVYALPFAEGQQVAISQAAFGSYSHPDKHAIDFSVPEGTPVHAARGGVVVGANTFYQTAEANRNYAKYGNYVLIQHADRTLGAYYHLSRNGARVRVGQKVKVGEMIALSGNTGFSSGPHLHFEVNSPTSGREVRTYETRFRVSGGSPQGELLSQGRRYTRPTR